MICIFTYFNKVSEFWFAICACAFFAANLVVKLIFTIKLKYYDKSQANSEKEEVTEDGSIETLIQSTDEGEVE